MAAHNLVASTPAASSSSSSCSWMLHRSQFPETPRSRACFTDPLSARDFSQHGLSLQQSGSSCSFICCSKPYSKPSVRGKRLSRLAKGSKRDAELRKELQSFLAAAGLPSDQVPSMKELSNRGRVDLANVVRRRGYKAIATLLASSEMVSRQDNESYIDDAVETDDSNVVEYSTQVMNHDGKSLNGSARGVEYDRSKFTNLSKERWSEHGSLQSTEISYETPSDEDLQKKASEFVKTGQFEEMQVADEGDYERHEEEEGEEEEQLVTDYEDSSDEDETDVLWEEQTSAEAIAIHKAAKLRAKILPVFKERFLAKMSNQAVDSLFNIKEEFQALPNLTKETQLEISHIKSALLNKESELAEMSRELQETKAQLALVQAKAAAELAQAKQISIEKDMHLKTIDHVLANLKQVQVEYWGEGSRVELAGSFNGWKHFIPMQPDPTSEIPKPDGSRGPMMWMVELWLYPGIYEVNYI